MIHPQTSGMGAQMKKIALQITALATLFAAPAMAADMAVPVKAMPPAPAFTWTGCYVGVHAGAGWETSSYTSEGGMLSGVGALGGAQAGCNYQWNIFVIGLEGEFWGSGLYDRQFDQGTNFIDDAKARNIWDGAISARAGLTVYERAFIYGKLGGVAGRFKYSTSDSSSSPPPSSFSETGSATFIGVLMGLGLEYALTNNWTAKIEYNLIDYGNKIVNFTDVRCTPGCTTSPFSATIKERKELIKLGMNYKF